MLAAQRRRSDWLHSALWAVRLKCLGGTLRATRPTGPLNGCGSDHTVRVSHPSRRANDRSTLTPWNIYSIPWPLSPVLYSLFAILDFRYGDAKALLYTRKRSKVVSC